MRYRFYGDNLQLIRYEVKISENHVMEASAEDEKNELLAHYPDAVVTEIDNTGYEWLDGMTFTQEQLRNGEVEKAIQMGEAAYTAMRNAPTQEEINAILLLQIAELKAGGANE